MDYSQSPTTSPPAPESGRAECRLACQGGRPAFPEGPPSWPIADEAIRDRLLAAWSDGTWGRYRAPHEESLAAALCELGGVEHAYPVCSGTFATELALRMLQIGPGDEVVLAAYDFPGNFRAIEAVGARPVLVDVRRGTWTIDIEQFDQVQGPAVKGLIVSHLHGCLAPMPEVMARARRLGWKVVEDACQVPGARVSGQPAGSWGDVGTFSFGGSKLLTAGRGGAVLTSSPQLLQRARVLCERGNHAYPLSSLQAAVLVPQCEQLAECHARRSAAVRILVEQYSSCWSGGERVPLVPCLSDLPNSQPAFYKVGWRVVPHAEETVADLAARCQAIADAVQAEGIALDAGFRGFTSRSTKRCRRANELPHAAAAAAGTLVLHHPVLLAPTETIIHLATTLAAVGRFCE